MTIHVGATSPPHRESLVAEFHVSYEDRIDIPAEMYEQDGRLMIAIYPREGGEPWEFPLADFVEAIGKGMAVLAR